MILATNPSKALLTTFDLKKGVILFHNFTTITILSPNSVPKKQNSVFKNLSVARGKQNFQLFCYYMTTLWSEDTLNNGHVYFTLRKSELLDCYLSGGIFQFLASS
jgi:hypothetical protein